MYNAKSYFYYKSGDIFVKASSAIETNGSVIKIGYYIAMGIILDIVIVKGTFCSCSLKNLTNVLYNASDL